MSSLTWAAQTHWFRIFRCCLLKYFLVYTWCRKISTGCNFINAVQFWVHKKCYCVKLESRSNSHSLQQASLPLLRENSCIYMLYPTSPGWTFRGNLPFGRQRVCDSQSEAVAVLGSGQRECHPYTTVWLGSLHSCPGSRIEAPWSRWPRRPLKLLHVTRLRASCNSCHSPTCIL